MGRGARPTGRAYSATAGKRCSTFAGQNIAGGTMRTSHFHPYAVALVVSLLVNSSASSGFITAFDGGAPNGLPAGPISGFVLADDFVLSSPTQLTRVTFWSLERPALPWNGVLNYYFFEDEGFSPSLTPFVSGVGVNITRTPTGNITGTPEDPMAEMRWVVEFDHPITLPEQHRFWFGITAGTVTIPVAPGPQGLFWEASSTTFGATARRGTFASPNELSRWEELTPARHVSFLLEAHPVPEPSGMVLVTSGLIAFLWFRKRMGGARRSAGDGAEPHSVLSRGDS
jgi:hypothetical protein